MKTKSLLSGLALLATSMLFTGCYDNWHSIDGNYDVETEIRQLPDFHRVFINHSKTRNSFACIKNFCVSAIYNFNKTICRCSNATHSLQNIQRSSFAR